MTNKKFWAYVFSILPGAGHLYLGIQKKGIELMACFFGVMFLSDITNMHLFGLIMPIIWFYSIFDVRKILYLGCSKDQSLNFNFNFDGNIPKIIACMFIIVGIWSLLINVIFPVFDIYVSYRIENYVRVSIGSLILIFLGVRLLKGNKKLLLPGKKEDFK